MKEIRELIQKKLSEIKNLDSGPAVPDDVIEKGKNYFGYEIYKDFIESDFDKNYTFRLSIIGRLVRKESSEENTLEIIDDCTEQLEQKLKELNIKYSIRDVSLDNGIRKKQVTGETKFNDLNKKFIV